MESIQRSCIPSYPFLIQVKGFMLLPKRWSSLNETILLPQKNSLHTKSSTTAHFCGQKDSFQNLLRSIMRPSLVQHCTQPSCEHTRWCIIYQLHPRHLPFKVSCSMLELSLGIYLGPLRNFQCIQNEYLIRRRFQRRHRQHRQWSSKNARPSPCDASGLFYPHTEGNMMITTSALDIHFVKFGIIE